MVLIVINRMLRRNVFVPQMSVSMACTAAQCIPVEGSTLHFAQVRTLEAILHRDFIPRDIVDSGRRVLVASMSIGDNGGGGELIGWWS